jgi:tetratricopeptide (TPR) repeat protein
MSLQVALKNYEVALDAFKQPQPATFEIKALDVLTARDAVQHWLEKTPPISGEPLVYLKQLDDRLDQQKTNIYAALDLEHWRSLLNPRDSATWWYPQPPALLPFLEKRHPVLERFDWLFTFASLFFLTLAVTVVLDTLNRVVGEGLNTQGLFPVVVQVLLTIAGGSAALTQNGRNFLRMILTRLRIPTHWRQEFSAIAALLILLIVAGIHELYLPQLASDRYQQGIAHYEAQQFDSALQAYKQSLALQPDFVEAHYSLGLIYEDLQQTDEAIAAYQRVVSQDADALDKLIWLRAHNNLGRLHILKGDYRTAWVPLDRAFNAITEADLSSEEMQFERYNLLKNLGWMWLGQGRLLEADEFLQQAIAQNPERAAAHCLQAQVLTALEQPEIAQASWLSCLGGERNLQPEEAEWAAMAASWAGGGHGRNGLGGDRAQCPGQRTHSGLGGDGGDGHSQSSAAAAGGSRHVDFAGGCGVAAKSDDGDGPVSQCGWHLLPQSPDAHFWFGGCVPQLRPTQFPSRTGRG